MTKEEALQKVNDYCNEKSYTNATLTDGFKDKFAEHLAKRHPDTAADDETALGDMRFAYDKFMDGEKKTTKFKNIMELAKKGIRQNLHASFEKFATDYDVKLDKEDKEQADALVTRFKEIFKDSIGDIAPLAPQQTQKRDEDFIASLKKVKVQ